MTWRYEHRPDAVHSKHVFTNPDTGEVVAVDDLGALYEGWLAQQAREADAVGDLTRAELVAALKVERERYEALAEDVRRVARPMQLAGLRVKFSGDLLYEEEVPVIAALFKDTEPQEARP